MKIAITADGDLGLDSPVAQHFGHASYFVLAEVEDGKIGGVKVLVNPYAEKHEPGEIPAFIKTQGVQVILSGGMGGRAIEFFHQAGIEVATGATGTVKESLDKYLGEGLIPAAPCAESVAHGHGHKH